MPKKADTKEASISLEAHNLIHGQKRKDYGPVEDSFRKIACIATLTCQKDITPGDICRILVAQKIVRESQSPELRDSLIDVIGYTDLLQQLKDLDVADESIYIGYFKEE